MDYLLLSIVILLILEICYLIHLYFFVNLRIFQDGNLKIWSAELATVRSILRVSSSSSSQEFQLDERRSLRARVKCEWWERFKWIFRLCWKDYVLWLSKESVKRLPRRRIAQQLQSKWALHVFACVCLYVKTLLLTTQISKSVVNCDLSRLFLRSNMVCTRD